MRCRGSRFRALVRWGFGGDGSEGGVCGGGEGVCLRLGCEGLWLGRVGNHCFFFPVWCAEAKVWIYWGLGFGIVGGIVHGGDYGCCKPGEVICLGPSWYLARHQP